MFPLPLGLSNEDYVKIFKNRTSEMEDKRIILERKIHEVKKAMKDYIETFNKHPRFSMSGMMYYSHLNTEMTKLKKEYEANYGNNVLENDMKISKNTSKNRHIDTSKNTNVETPKSLLNERVLRSGKRINYTV